MDIINQIRKPLNILSIKKPYIVSNLKHAFCSLPVSGKA